MMEKKHVSSDAHLWTFQTFVVEFWVKNTARDESEKLSEKDIRAKIMKALLAAGIEVDHMMVIEK